MNIPREFSRPVRIGNGTFSTVYRVYQPALERHVALKILPYSKKQVNTAIDQEMRILASLQLSCVPHIYDVKSFRNQIVLVMEWIRGVPLSLLFKLPIPAECRMVIATSIVKNLANLHTSNVIHGDLKPENILITSDLRVLFVDFGFSLLQNVKEHANGVIQGTPGFMAPELWSSDTDSINYKKVDLYALGIVLREFSGDAFPAFANDLTAEDPLQRPSDAVVFEKIWSGNIKSDAVIEVCSDVVAGAVMEYLARMLLSGSRELYAKGKSEDAYALLTESLEIWPDQQEALEFLQQKYSSPVKKYGIKRMAVAAASAVIIVLLLTIAYFAGKQDSVSGIGSFNVSNDDVQKVSLVLPSQRNQILTSPPVALRETGGGMNLPGTLSIWHNPEKKGKLIIDGAPVAEFSNGTISIQLKAGLHRVEWIDSVSQKRFGEIVELLPFEHKKISVKRFVDGKRK